MKKLILTACVVAFALTSKANVTYGIFKGFKKVRGTAVINCKAKPTKVCAIVVSQYEEGNDTGNWLVTVKDEFENTVYSAQCSKVFTESDGEGGTTITAVEIELP